MLVCNRLPSNVTFLMLQIRRTLFAPLESLRLSDSYLFLTFGQTFAWKTVLAIMTEDTTHAQFANADLSYSDFCTA